MAYLVCSQCGGKALAVSSRCPRCQTPFPRVEDRTPPAPKSVKLPVLITGAILVVVAGGYALWLSQNGKQHVEPVAAPTASTTAEAPVLDSANALRTMTDTGKGLASSAQTAASPLVAPVTQAAAPAAVSPAPPVTSASQATPATAVGDSVRWERAIVRNDVNLRRTASRDGESLKVLRIDQPVELGAFQEGWRQVRLGTMIGWADPRHFEIVPKKR